MALDQSLPLEDLRVADVELSGVGVNAARTSSSTIAQAPAPAAARTSRLGDRDVGNDVELRGKLRGRPGAGVSASRTSSSAIAVWSSPAPPSMALRRWNHLSKVKHRSLELGE